MFFNSFKSRMKKAYDVLDKTSRDAIFPNGQAEFLYVAETLNGLYSNADLTNLIPTYGSVYVYSGLQKGNYYGIYKYAKKKMPNFSDDDVFKMIALITLNQSQNKNFQQSIPDQIEKFKGAIKKEVESFIAIEQHPEIFNTKKGNNVGTEENPILLPGLSGVEKYFADIVDKNGESIKYERTGCTYYTEPKTGINYAVDKYTIKNEKDGHVICDVFINEYGTEICKLCPKDLKIKK